MIIKFGILRKTSNITSSEKEKSGIFVPDIIDFQIKFWNYKTIDRSFINYVAPVKSPSLRDSQ